VDSLILTYPVSGGHSNPDRKVKFKVKVMVHFTTFVKVVAHFWVVVKSNQSIGSMCVAVSHGNRPVAEYILILYVTTYQVSLCQTSGGDQGQCCGDIRKPLVVATKVVPARSCLPGRTYQVVADYRSADSRVINHVIVTLQVWAFLYFCLVASTS